VRIGIGAQDRITGYYHAADFRIMMKATGENAVVNFSTTPVYVGQGKETPWTPKEIHDKLISLTSMHTVIVNKLKEAYLSVVNIDISN